MVISVLIEININKKEKTFDYIVPSNLEEFIKMGIRVKVPFSGRILEGFVLDIKKNSNYDLKEIIDVIDKKPILNKELLELGKTISKDNLCNLISIYQSMLPKGLKASSKNKISIKKDTYIKINDIDKVNEFISSSRAYKQVEVLNELKKEELILKNKYNGSIIKPLLEKGLIIEEYKEYYRLKDESVTKDFKILNSEQKRCIKEIEDSKKNIILLHGVTGSGKTEIYIDLIQKTIKKDKEVIMLLPEISLTPQIIERLKNHFSSNIAILHSGLSDGEKFDEYRKILNKEVKIVVGARSAIFAPFENIGLIIMDEEHSQTYKQDHNPRYNALDVAFIRANTHKAKVILGSATPSIESYARSKKGYYELVTIKKRANNKPLPLVTVVNMEKEIKKGNSILSEPLKLAIEDRLNKKEQVMLLINKRGYSSYLMCSNCGRVFKCPNCDITLTYHKTSNMNRCHYCGYAENKIEKCPDCNNNELKSYGLGTEKVEEEIIRLFPEARTIRMDIDTTTRKGSHKKIIESFSNHEKDILIGTQMISKGLDFPLVTLVGVISADTILNLPDFRSNEKTFELISQVSGRSGRGEKEGRVIIQTFNEDNYSIKYAKTHNYEKFYEEEIKIRKKLLYPPYFFIANLIISGKDYVTTINEAKKVGAFVRNRLDKTFIVLGPSSSYVARINNIYHFEVIIKYRNKEKMLEVLNELKLNMESVNKVKLDIDINPISL